jgi:type IV pilus biogenesis protein CpaD/CtpE
MILSVLLMILLISSCQTTDSVKYEVPPFNLSMPTRPILKSIESDIEPALKSLTTNMGLLAEYSEKLEVFIKYMDNYYTTVIQIITH